MRRVYQIPLVSVSVTTDNDQDIFELIAAAGGPCELRGFSLSSNCTTDERLALRLVRRTTTGTGGSAATEVPTDDENTTTPGATLNTLVTAPGTLGDVLSGWIWSQQGEFLYLPTPEDRETIVAGGRLCLNLQSAVAATRTWSGWVKWAE